MWRFAHVTDPHLASDRDGEWNNRFLCTMMPGVMACLKRDLALLQPEFILATGDICSHQTREAMLQARDAMDGLGIPYFPMGGNHDFVKPESRAWFLEAFAHILPQPRAYYSFDHKNLHFCVLDPWWQWTDGTLCEAGQSTVAAELDMSLKDARWAVPPPQLEWLMEDLQMHADRAAILAIHEPILPTPVRMQRPNYNDSGALSNGELILDILERFPQVKAVFSGHMHMNYIERARSITQVVTSALPEFPVEYREVCVYEDRIEVRAKGLSDPSFAERSLIPGKDWTRGTPEDRETVIPLR